MSNGLEMGSFLVTCSSPDTKMHAFLNQKIITGNWEARLTWLYKKFSHFYTISRRDLSQGVLESQKSIVFKFLPNYVEYFSVNEIIHKSHFLLMDLIYAVTVTM